MLGHATVEALRRTRSEHKIGIRCVRSRPTDVRPLARAVLLDGRVAEHVPPAHARLLRWGYVLESITLGWNVIGVAVLAAAAIAARSVALAGFGLDSLIEIGASTVVICELSGTGAERQRRALRLIGLAFVALAVYLSLQSVVVIAARFAPHPSPVGIAWTGVTALLMFTLAAGKARTGRALGNPVLLTEGRVTLIDGILATAVLIGLLLNAVLGWWWADPLAAFVLAYYAVREGRAALS